MAASADFKGVPKGFYSVHGLLELFQERSKEFPWGFQEPFQDVPKAFRGIPIGG